MNLAEGVQLVSFAILAGLVIISALGVVLLSNIVYSAFLLGGVFIGISGIYILLNADFIAAAQILIYVGAINVLILFAIMLVNKKVDYSNSSKTSIRQVSSIIVCGGIFALLSTVIYMTPWNLKPVSPEVLESTVIKIGRHLFSDFLLPFELASILLLIAMVGAIVLARRDLIPEIYDSEGISTALELPERLTEEKLQELSSYKSSDL
ncbi:NADH-quinone oxidoreductase subunit J [Candidatus Atelocyanobacterium thalassae]|uniref:NADH-quinone oxidoreductase subunit J n=1 Tax=cyanobacterium endosymbiont of Braarudosphaera bigelowii TaxID=1285375 RepID=A0ABM7UCS9_9CHRO|nr:NADH-quinone oxidoreductase subunit J [Candidatus Atelocyanobacterium thalassa]BDA40245.1 hypothetical protein CPARK_000108300 [cyanobacterium endosymbiont of Braarudosphaera bigelowii]